MPTPIPTPIPTATPGDPAALLTRDATAAALTAAGYPIAAKTLGGNPHLPLHLREICAILAADLVRLRSRSAEECARDAAETGDHGEFRLHILPHQRGRATRTNRRDA